jgi:SAM-dependent methyltransferase
VTADRELEEAVADIREEYGRRESAPQCAGEYSFLNPTHVALVFDREAAILAALARHLGRGLDQATILDVGCSTGLSLALLAVYGADASRLHGVDIDADRVARGRHQFPSLDLRVTNGHELEFEDASFDVVQQITMLSSVHSEALRRRLGGEMLRVLRPGGLLLSYDATPVGLLPRMVNRALARRRRPVVSPDEGVRLTPIVPLRAADLSTIFPGARAVEVRRLTPYRPLVERVAGSPAAVGLFRQFGALSSALLFVGRKE